MEIQNQNITDLEKYVTERIIREDIESIREIMLSDRNAIFAMAIIPYYALCIQSCQEYVKDPFLSEEAACKIKDIRNHIKTYDEGFGKKKRRIQEIDSVQDIQFRDKLRFGSMRKMNLHKNLGTYWTADKHIVGNTQLYADFLEIESMFDKRSGERLYELGVQIGSFFSMMIDRFGLEHKAIEAKASIKIDYYVDLNTNCDKTHFFINESKELNIYLLHLLCNMNFVKYVLRNIFHNDNTWVFRVEYVVTYYTYRALNRLKNYSENNMDITIDGKEISGILDAGATLFQSKFRNCMMHYDLVARDVISEKYLDREFYGIVESCFEGMDYETYVKNIRELADMIICFLEKQFDVSEIVLKRL